MSTWRRARDAAGDAAVRFQACAAHRDRRLRHRDYAGHVAKYWFERLARLPVEIDVASEFRYREAPLRKGDLAIFISQSGETADTLAALRYAKCKACTRCRVVNVPTSTIARESETVLPTLAGPGDRRRLDQGVHLPADGTGVARGRRRQGARRIVRRGRDQAGPWPDRSAPPDGGGADANRRSKSSRANRQMPRTCSISAAAPAIRWRWKAR